MTLSTLAALVASLPLLASSTPAAAGPPTPGEVSVGAGCGEDGPTRSAAKPTVRLPASLGLRTTGSVRMTATDPSQTAGATVQLVQRGGRRVGGTAPGTYTCTDASATVNRIAIPLNAYGLRLVRRTGSLVVVVRLRLVNGSGVTNAIERSAVIRPEPLRRSAGRG